MLKLVYAIKESVDLSKKESVCDLCHSSDPPAKITKATNSVRMINNWYLNVGRPPECFIRRRNSTGSSHNIPQYWGDSRGG